MTDENKEQEPLNQAPEAAAPETAEEPSQTIERLQQEVEHWKNAVLRERADGESLRKRLEREALNASKFATERLIKDLIPTLDALTLGLSAAQNQNEEEKNWQEFLKGSELTLKSLLETLQRPPRKPLAEILASMPDVGLDSDFERQQDDGQSAHVFD